MKTVLQGRRNTTEAPMAGYGHCNNLIIGLGGTGGRVVRELKDSDFNSLSKDCDFQFLCIDSSMDYSYEFASHEFCNIYTDIKNTDDYNGILSTNFGQTDSSAIWNNIKPIAEGCHWMESWIDSGGAKQNRRAGRMMFGAHILDIDGCFHHSVRILHERTGRNPHIDLHIYIIAHLSGGTGSGSLVDMIMLIKRYYRDAKITVVGILPTLPPPAGHDVGRYLANAYATLMELNALNHDKYTPIDISTGVRHRRTFIDEAHAHNKLFTLLLLNNDKVADIICHLATMPRTDQTKPFIDKLDTELVSTLGFSKIVHPNKEFERNFSYDGSEERHIWNKLFRDADCKLIAEDTEHMRLACVPYSSDEENSFVPALKWMNKILRGNQDIWIDNSLNDRDEVSMMSLGFGFQLRTISIMPALRKQYEQLLSSNRTNAISMLHIEDSCEELSPLYDDKNNQGRKAPYILLAWAMDILCKDYDLEGNKIWAYKTKGYRPDGTPANGIFFNRLNWLDPAHNYIYEHEIPSHLWEYIKRDVDNMIDKNRQDSVWMENIQKNINTITSALRSEREAIELEVEKREAFHILYPEKLQNMDSTRIVLIHFYCSIMLQAIRQLLYCNMKNKSGFINEPRPIDWKDQIRDATFVEHWGLAHHQLSLEDPLKAEQYDDQPFELFWDYMADIGLEEAMPDRSNPISKMNDFMQTAYDQLFRKVGVKNYFKEKKLSLHEITGNHISHIERYIDDGWKEGEYGAYDIVQLTRGFCEYLQEMKDNNKRRVNLVMDELECLEKQLKDLSEAYQNWLTRIVRGERILREYRDRLRDYYLQKTRVESLEFEYELNNILFGRIYELSRRWEPFVNYLELSHNGVQEKMSRLKDLTPDEKALVDWNKVLIYEQMFNSEMKRHIMYVCAPLTDFLQKTLGDREIKDIHKYVDHHFLEDESSLSIFKETVNRYNKEMQQIFPDVKSIFSI